MNFQQWTVWWTCALAAACGPEAAHDGERSSDGGRGPADPSGEAGAGGNATSRATPSESSASDAGSATAFGGARSEAGDTDAASAASDGEASTADGASGFEADCLALADAICNRVADCDQALADLMENQRMTAFTACKLTFMRSHDCNQATHVADDFDACVASAKAADCAAVFITDFAAICDDKLVLTP